MFASNGAALRGGATKAGKGDFRGPRRRRRRAGASGEGEDGRGSGPSDRGRDSVTFPRNDASARGVARGATRRAERGASRALEAPPPFPSARGCSRLLVRDDRERKTAWSLRSSGGPRGWRRASRGRRTLRRPCARHPWFTRACFRRGGASESGRDCERSPTVRPVDQHALSRTSRRVLGSREACARELSQRLEVTWRDDRAVDATAFARARWTIRVRCNAA